MSKKCEKLHELFNGMKRHSFPFKEEEIPLNGIYILFQKDEKGHGKDRMVRIGTHTGKDQLRSRLWQHFMNPNKDRSIFRKNIGRALLNKAHDLFLNQWQVDLTAKEAREKYANRIDLEKQKKIEEEVSEYIQENFTFVVFEIKDKNERLALESKLISTISMCQDCSASRQWLGRFSPVKKICKSGLWQVNELYKMPLSDKEMSELKRLLCEP